MSRPQAPQIAELSIYEPNRLISFLNFWSGSSFQNLCHITGSFVYYYAMFVFSYPNVLRH